MRAIVSIIVMVVFFSPNILCADVRTGEHPQKSSIPNFEQISLPDPLDAIVPPPDVRSAPRRPLRMPADGRISSWYGWRTDPIVGGRRFHSGVDFANFRSSMVRAAAEGLVRFAGRAAGCGLMAAIDHGGGVQTRYCHLDHLAVHCGEHVAPGGVVGFMGSTGRATGSHLHFELLSHGTAIDPAEQLTF